MTTEVVGTHTETDSYEIITDSVDFLAEILPQPQGSIVESPAFRENIGWLAGENDGYLYFQWQKVYRYLANRFLPLRILELTFKPLFDNLQSVTVTSEGIKDGIVYGSVFFRLSP